MVWKNSPLDVFTFVSSVEELNAEIQMISREISEVVIHATETTTDKDIGAIEINNIQSKLGHDGIDIIMSFVETEDYKEVDQ